MRSKKNILADITKQIETVQNNYKIGIETVDFFGIETNTEECLFRLFHLFYMVQTTDSNPESLVVILREAKEHMEVTHDHKDLAIRSEFIKESMLKYHSNQSSLFWTMCYFFMGEKKTEQYMTGELVPDYLI